MEGKRSTGVVQTVRELWERARVCLLSKTSTATLRATQSFGQWNVSQSCSMGPLGWPDPSEAE